MLYVIEYTYTICKERVKKMKEHDQVYLKVFKVEVEPENVIIVNYIGNKEDITDIAAYLNCHIDCVNMDILLERLIHRKMQAYLETEGNWKCKTIVKRCNKFLDERGCLIKPEILEIYFFAIVPEKYCNMTHMSDDMKNEIIESIKANSTIWEDTRLAREEKLK